MKKLIAVFLGLLFLSCGTPRLKQMNAASGFTAENIMMIRLFISPVLNLTAEKNLVSSDFTIESSMQSKRKYYNWVGVSKTVKLIKDAGLSKELEECIKQSGEGKTIDPGLIRGLSPALDNNYIVFTVLKNYDENNYSRSTADFTNRKNINSESYYSYLTGTFCIYDLKSGMQVFSTLHTVEYYDEKTIERNQRDSGKKAGDIAGDCITDFAASCITGMVISYMAPDPEQMARKFFDEIGENLPEKK